MRAHSDQVTCGGGCGEPSGFPCGALPLRFARYRALGRCDPLSAACQHLLTGGHGGPPPPAPHSGGMRLSRYHADQVTCGGVWGGEEARSGGGEKALLDTVRTHLAPIHPSRRRHPPPRLRTATRSPAEGAGEPAGFPSGEPARIGRRHTSGRRDPMLAACQTLDQRGASTGAARQERLTRMHRATGRRDPTPHSRI